MSDDDPRPALGSMYTAEDLNAAILKEHATHVQFANDIYAILVDPLEGSFDNEADLFAQCLKAATDQRQALHDAQNARREGYAEGERDMLIERTAQIAAHRVCCGTEHDPANGKLHGYCVVCGVPWPCDYAGKPPVRALPGGTE